MNANRNELVISHLFLARAMARQMKNRLPSHIDIDDLVSAGYVGLVQAADKFDQRSKVPFSIFASYRIRGAIYDMFRQEDWTPRIIRRRARESGEELPKMIPFSAAGLKNFDRYWRADDITLDRDPGLISRLLSSLDDRSRRVVSMRYLDDLSMESIAIRLDVSISRVSQINKVALATMRLALREDSQGAA